MNFAEVEASKYIEEACRLAAESQEADALARHTPRNSPERQAAREVGQALGELFERIALNLHAGGLDSEYEAVAREVCAYALTVTGVDIRIFS